MIKQLRMGFRLLRYAHGIKTCILSMIVTLAVGIALEWSTVTVTGTDYHAAQNVGGYLILVTALWPMQMLISLNVPDVVASSPWKKRIQTSVFAISSAIFYLIAYAITAGIKMIRYSQGVLSRENLTLELLLTSFVLIMLILYMAVCLKYYIAATIVFCVAMAVTGCGQALLFYAMSADGLVSRIAGGIPPLAAVIIGVFTIIIGSLLSYGILCLLYKKPVSKYSQMNSLQKRM